MSLINSNSRTYVLGSTSIWTCPILNICFDFFPQRLLEENNNKYLQLKIQSLKFSTCPNWWAAKDIREKFIKTEMAFFVFSKMKPNFHWGGWLRKHWRPWTISRKNLMFGPLVQAHYMILRILWSICVSAQLCTGS